MDKYVVPPWDVLLGLDPGDFTRVFLHSSEFLFACFA